MFHFAPLEHAPEYRPLEKKNITKSVIEAYRPRSGTWIVSQSP